MQPSEWGMPSFLTLDIAAALLAVATALLAVAAALISAFE